MGGVTGGRAAATIVRVSGENAAGHPHIQWLSDPAVLAPLALLAGIYIWRFRQARREGGGRGAGALQAAAFAGAMVALLAALVSPIDGLGDDHPLAVMSLA